MGRSVSDTALQSLTIPGAFALAGAQLADRRVIALLVKSAFVTIVLVALLVGAGFAGFSAGFAALAGAEGGWLQTLGQLAAIVIGILSAWLLWRIVAMAVLQFYADEVIGLVEARHYPAFEPRNVPLAEEVSMALRGGVRAILVNMGALPFALLLLFTGVGTAILFAVVNAFLLGRELQDMVWARHPGAVRQGTAGAPLAASTRFLLGLAVVGLLAVPFANLLAPFIGAAAATHLVHRAAARNRVSL